jgi:site-specific recombinase XerC
VKRDDPPKLAPRTPRPGRPAAKALPAAPSNDGHSPGTGAICRLLFYSGVRISELVALDDHDVPLSARKGKVIVRSGKGESSREVPLLDTIARESVADWRKNSDMPAVNSSGRHRMVHGACQQLAAQVPPWLQRC